MRPTEINPADYDKQLAQKVDSVEQSFAAFSMPNVEVFTSAALNYRMRAEFRMWHDGEITLTM